jgi:hypothetical protein
MEDRADRSLADDRRVLGQEAMLRAHHEQLQLFVGHILKPSDLAHVLEDLGVRRLQHAHSAAPSVRCLCTVSRVR